MPPRVIRVSGYRVNPDELLPVVERMQPKRVSRSELHERATMLAMIACEVATQRWSEESAEWPVVPHEVQERLQPIIVRLICVAHFSRASQELLDDAIAWLNSEPGGTYGKRWQHALTNILTHSQERAQEQALPEGRVGPDIFWNEDGSPADASTVVRRTASSVLIRAGEAPFIFHRLRLVGGGGTRDDELTDDERGRFAKATAVVERLQRNGVQPDGVRGANGRVTPEGAARLLALALGLPFARGKSRVDRSAERTKNAKRP